MEFDGIEEFDEEGLAQIARLEENAQKRMKAVDAAKDSGPPRSGWGSLRPPSERDIKGRASSKGLAAAPPPLTHLVVLDFEWTADERKKMLPCSEITQFPSVLVRLNGRDQSFFSSSIRQSCSA
jgi:hypothetical protein